MFTFALSFSVKGYKVLHLVLSSVSGRMLHNGFEVHFFIPKLHVWLLIVPLWLEYPLKIEFVSAFGNGFELEWF